MKHNRVLIGAVVLATVLLVLTVDYHVEAVRGIPSSALLAVVAFAASYELCIVLKSAGFDAFPRLTAFASFVVALTPAVSTLLLPTVSDFAPQAGLIFLFVIVSFVMAILKEDMQAGVKSVIGGTFVLVYVGFALSFLVRLRGLGGIGGPLLIFVL
jgi:hypothetical protein